MSRYEAIAKAKVVGETRELVPEINGPMRVIKKVFAPQSWFDSTLLQKAIAAQDPNTLIVPSTKVEDQQPGYGLALSPTSETPLAVQFKASARSGSGHSIILRPGDVWRPQGRPDGKPGSFTGFDFGVPFGWLGGGLAHLAVLQSPDADVSWHGQKEVVFHRTRMQIADPTTINADAPKNWPMRFPWSQAIQGTNSIKQQAAPIIAIEPTRTLLRIRLNSLAAPATMRMLFQGTQDFDLDSAGAAQLNTGVSFFDVVWPSFTQTVLGGGNLATHYPVIEIDLPESKLGADDGGVQLIQQDGGSSLIGAYVDIVRYGRL